MFPINDLVNADVFPSCPLFSSGSLVYVFDDNEAVIKMHVSRTHRVSLDWLFDRINVDPEILIKYIDTKEQLADILTKGNFTRDEWHHLMCLFTISHVSSTDCSEVMSKRTPKNSGEERSHSKVEADDQFGLLMCSSGLHQKAWENQTRKSISSELAN